jgi:hypothetical protein
MKQSAAVEVCHIAKALHQVQDLVTADQAVVAQADIITQKADSGRRHLQDTEVLLTIIGIKDLWLT